MSKTCGHRLVPASLLCLQQSQWLWKLTGLSPVYTAVRETSKYRAWSLSARSSWPQTPLTVMSLLRLALGLEGLDDQEKWGPR